MATLLTNPLTKWSRTGVRGLPTRGLAGGLIGQAFFSSQGGVITEATVKGCIQRVTYHAAAIYKFWLWPYQPFYIPYGFSCDNGAAATTMHLSGLYTNVTPQSFLFQLTQYAPIIATDRPYVSVCVFGI